MIDLSIYEAIVTREALRAALDKARKELGEVTLPGFALFHRDRVAALEAALAKVIEIAGD